MSGSATRPTRFMMPCLAHCTTWHQCACQSCRCAADLGFILGFGPSLNLADQMRWPCRICAEHMHCHHSHHIPKHGCTVVTEKTYLMHQRLVLSFDLSPIKCRSTGCLACINTWCRFEGSLQQQKASAHLHSIECIRPMHGSGLEQQSASMALRSA